MIIAAITEENVHANGRTRGERWCDVAVIAHNMATTLTRMLGVTVRAYQRADGTGFDLVAHGGGPIDQGMLDAAYASALVGSLWRNREANIAQKLP